jgi:DNA-binding Lrp family transcriptional regulator
MSNVVEIDEIDAKILRELIKDARTKLKDIAKECGLSSNAIFKRVKRLKATGVITGTILYTNLALSGYEYPATIGINLTTCQEPEVVKLIRKHAHLIALYKSIGKYDLCAFVMAKTMAELDHLKQIIRQHPGIKRIAVNFWDTDTTSFHFENIDLQNKKS